jgi:hypothetical protein
MKQTKSALYVRTPSSSLPTIHVCYSRRTFFFLFFILFLTYLLTLSSHIVYFCVFFQNIKIIFDLFDDLISFFKLMLLYNNLSSYITYDYYYWIFFFFFYSTLYTNIKVFIWICKKKKFFFLLKMNLFIYLKEVYFQTSDEKISNLQLNVVYPMFFFPIV